MKLIVGLGNPGKKYECTRHNVGFMTIDQFASDNNAIFRLESKLKGMIANVNIGGKKAILLKPMTFMNLSGESVRAVMDYYKIDIADILVVCDDLDSRTGRLRLRANGSAGGHNGHKNIISHIGSEYKRLKIGIDRSQIIPVIDWVLQKFSEDELVEINKAIDTACIAINEFINEKPFERISSEYSIK